MTFNCQICGNDYKHCPECERGHSYKDIVDNPTCYKIYLILYELRENIIDKDKAKQEFAMINVTEKTLCNFKLIDAVRNKIAEIVKEEVDITKSEEVASFKKSKFKNK